MKQAFKLFLILLFLLPHFLLAQKKNIWIRFQDKRTELYGYKDATGKIKLPPKFTDLTNTVFFNNIMAVMEQDYSSYYILKNGKIIGRDSVLMSPDYYFDCESEEKIRFEDKKKEKVGFFDKNGKVIIPAIYDVAFPFHNGVALALTGARKKMFGTEGDPHWGLVGGAWKLINEKNEVLIDSIDIEKVRNINWYSMKVNATLVDTSNTINLKGKNGAIYTFIDYEREFKHWFDAFFVKNVSSKNINKVESNCFSEIVVNSYGAPSTKTLTNTAFISKYFQSRLYNTFKDINRNPSKKLRIGENYFFSQQSKKQAKFFDSCGELFKEKYPSFEVIIDYKNDTQNSFQFIRTENGYQLIGVVI